MFLIMSQLLNQFGQPDLVNVYHTQIQVSVVWNNAPLYFCDLKIQILEEFWESLF